MVGGERWAMAVFRSYRLERHSISGPVSFGLAISIIGIKPEFEHECGHSCEWQRETGLYPGVGSI